MPSRTRARARNLWSSGGAFLPAFNFYLDPPQSGISDYEDCQDTTMAPPFINDHPLMITRWTSNPLTINGESTWNGFGPIQFRDYKPSGRANYANAPTPSTIDYGYWVTKALGNLDPYKPVVDLPVFAFELKDLPGMLKDLGKVLSGKIKPSDVPGGYLAYRFGWAPLVSDVKSMFDFTKQVDNRVRYFRNLESGSTGKRTLFDGEIKRDVQSNGYQILAGVPSTGSYGYQADIETTEHIRIWATANAKLTMELPNNELGLRRLSARAAYGLTLRPESFWDAIPWTWLSDYMLNVGDFLAASSGLTRFKVTRLNIMATQDCRSSLVNTRLAGGISSTNSLLQTVRKSRSAFINPMPTIAATPFLTSGQTAILGALATASALRKVRR